MIEAILFGLQLGISCALLDHVARWTKRARRRTGDLARGLVVGSFVLGPPVILAWCTSEIVDWLVAVTATWTILALSRPDLRDCVRRA